MIDTTRWHATLPQALHRAAAGRGAITFVETADKLTRVTYADLLEKARAVAGALQSRGLRAGDELILNLDDNRTFLNLFWGAILAGVVPVPLATGAAASHRGKVLEVFATLRRGALATSIDQRERLRQFAQDDDRLPTYERLSSRIITLDQLTAGAPYQDVVETDAADTAFIQFSSGSTGTPKGVVLSHRNLLANIRSATLSARFEADDKFLSWMPLSHDMGIIGFHLIPLVNGFDQVLIPTSTFVRRPALWLEIAADEQATILSSPNFGYQHYLDRGMRGAPPELSHVHRIFNGAEPISGELCRRFMTALAPTGLPPESMYPVYGLAEASLAAAFPEPGVHWESVVVDRNAMVDGTVQVAEDGVELVKLGRSLVDQELRIADEGGGDVAADRIGRVQIRGPNVTDGYYDGGSLNRDAIDDDGWLETGDLGFFTADEQLVITGRAKDLVIVHGQNYYPEDLEATLIKTGAADPGKLAVAGVRKQNNTGEGLAVFVTHRGSADDFRTTMKEVRGALSEQIGIAADYVVPVHRIPKTTSGKVQRHELAKAFNRGDYDEIINALTVDEVTAVASNAESLESELLALCNQHLTDQRLAADDNIFDAGTSSLALAQIHESIDARWPEVLELTDFFDYPTVRELAAFLRSKLALAT